MYGKCHICIPKNRDCKYLGKWSICHLCHIFTPRYLYICDMFARSEIVQINFFSSLELPTVSLSLGEELLLLRLPCLYHIGYMWLISCDRPIVNISYIRLNPWAGEMKRIMCSDWLPERARWAHITVLALYNELVMSRARESTTSSFREQNTRCNKVRV